MSTERPARRPHRRATGGHHAIKTDNTDWPRASERPNWRGQVQDQVQGQEREVDSFDLPVVRHATLAAT